MGFKNIFGLLDYDGLNIFDLLKNEFSLYC